MLTYTPLSLKMSSALLSLSMLLVAPVPEPWEYGRVLIVAGSPGSTAPADEGDHVFAWPAPGPKVPLSSLLGSLVLAFL